MRKNIWNSSWVSSIANLWNSVILIERRTFLRTYKIGCNSEDAAITYNIEYGIGFWHGKVGIDKKNFWDANEIYSSVNSMSVSMDIKLYRGLGQATW